MSSEKLTNNRKWPWQWWRKSNPTASTPEVTVDLPTDNNTVPTVPPQMSINDLMYEQPRKLTFTVSQWIESEELLRDEGVVFGLAESPIQDKLDSISHYYEEKKQFHKLKSAMIDQDIETAKTLIDKEKNLAKQRTEDIEALAKRSDTQYSGILRNMLGGTVFILVLVGLYRFLYYLLDFRFDSPYLLALAFTLLGFFSLGQSVDFLFADTKDAETISKNKVIMVILDLILPFTLALYIASVTNTYVSIFECIATFFLLLVVFWIQGKSRLKIFDFMQTAFIISKKNKRDRKADESKKGLLEAENTKTEAKIKDLEAKIERMLEEKARFLPDDVLEATKQSKMRLFESEYKMAKFYKNQTNPNQKHSENL